MGEQASSSAAPPKGAALSAPRRSSSKIPREFRPSDDPPYPRERTPRSRKPPPSDKPPQVSQAEVKGFKDPPDCAKVPAVKYKDPPKQLVSKPKGSPAGNPPPVYGSTPKLIPPPPAPARKAPSWKNTNPGASARPGPPELPQGAASSAPAEPKAPSSDINDPVVGGDPPNPRGHHQVRFPP